MQRLYVIVSIIIVVVDAKTSGYNRRALANHLWCSCLFVSLTSVSTVSFANASVRLSCKRVLIQSLKALSSLQLIIIEYIFVISFKAG